MENMITFTKPKTASFEHLGLGKCKVVAAIRNNSEVLCLVGDDYAYQPAGGKKTLKEIINTCKEGETYYWKPIK